MARSSSGSVVVVLASAALFAAAAACSSERAASGSGADAGRAGEGAGAANAGGEDSASGGERDSGSGGSSAPARGGSGSVVGGSAEAGSSGEAGNPAGGVPSGGSASGAEGGVRNDDGGAGQGVSGGSDGASGGAAGSAETAAGGTEDPGGSGGTPSQGGSTAEGGAGGEGGSAGGAYEAIRIAVIGSSTAAGKNLPEGGYSESDSWVNRYAAYLADAYPGSTVSNLAVSGYSTYHALPTGTTNPDGQPAVDAEHNVSAALATDPHAIVVNFPSQSALVGETITVEEVLDNLETIVETAEAEGVAVWVATTQPSITTPEGVALLEELRDATLAEFGARALDFWTPLAAADGSPLPELLNSYDDVHPNAEGHRLLFERVEAADLPAALGY